MNTRSTTSKVIATCSIGIIFGLAGSVHFLTEPTTLQTNSPAANHESAPQTAYGKLPLSFEPNHGQTAEQVKFLARGAGYTLFLTGPEAVMALSDASDKTKSSTVRMNLVGANRDALASGLNQLPGKSNYFVGDDPKKWRTDVPNYAKVEFAEYYPGVDVVYYGTRERHLEYDFVVAPHANPKAIKFSFEGIDKMELDKQGNLGLRLNGKELQLRKPVVYQEIGGTRQEIAGAYVRTGEREIGFEIPAYDSTRPLVIDPVLIYSTFLGGSGQDTRCRDCGQLARQRVRHGSHDFSQLSDN